MGREYDAICNACRHRSTVQEGGGFAFFELHCDQCGRVKEVGHDEIGFNGASEHWREMAEYYAGSCKCGGVFKVDAPPRCPKCRSTDLIEDPDAPPKLYD